MTEQVKLIKHVFTPEEREELSGTLARLISKKMDIETQKQAMAAELGGQIKNCQLEMQEHGRKITNGYEMRSVVCRREPDYASRMWRFYDSDGEEVAAERMKAYDLQMTLEEAELQAQKDASIEVEFKQIEDESGFGSGASRDA